jgi:hypothetical protein
MKTFISDLIPKLQRFSQKLDNLTLLTNQHWVVIDEISNNKNVYIFRTNNELLISQNGKVEKAKWEYLGNNSLLIDKKDQSYLFKHGFFDENILALKVDSKNEYAFLINENKYEGELNSIEKVIDFLTRKYIEPQIRRSIIDTTGIDFDETKQLSKETELILVSFETDKGKIEIELNNTLAFPEKGKRAFSEGKPAPTDKYKFGFLWYVYIENGIVTKVTIL